MKYIKIYEDFNGFKYPSDETRYLKLVEHKDDKITKKYPTNDEIDASLWDMDGVFVYNRGEYIEFIEYWAHSCWEGLYTKTEYKGLTKKKAIDKFILERFSKIAEKSNMKILDFSFIPNYIKNDEDWEEDVECDMLKIKLIRL
jgi:hypothetical protein